MALLVLMYTYTRRHVIECMHGQFYAGTMKHVQSTVMYTAEVELVTDQISECTSTTQYKCLINNYYLGVQAIWPYFHLCIQSCTQSGIFMLLWHKERCTYTIVLLWFNCGETLD